MLVQMTHVVYILSLKKLEMYKSCDQFYLYIQYYLQVCKYSKKHKIKKTNVQISVSGQPDLVFIS